ncbi:MAG: DUF4249 family protein [Bacteroidales bacterium]
MIKHYKIYNQIKIVIANLWAGMWEVMKQSQSRLLYTINYKDCFAPPLRPALWLAMTAASLLLVTSCEEKIDWQLETEYVNTIVVNGIITNEVKYQQIRLTKPFASQNDQPVAVSGASIKIIVDNVQVQFFESPENKGYYISEIPVAATVDKTYQLFIQSEGKDYDAKTYMIPVIPTAPPYWVYNATKELYTIGWPAGQYSQFEQAMYEAEISWTHLLDSAYTDSVSTAKLMYYTFNTIDVSYVIFPQDKEEVYFPLYSKAVVKKYSLTDEYAAFLRALLAETEWQGSLFEDARGNLPGNISNGGLGYFGACSVISDTLLVGL